MSANAWRSLLIVSPVTAAIYAALLVFLDPLAPGPALEDLLGGRGRRRWQSRRRGG